MMASGEQIPIENVEVGDKYTPNTKLYHLIVDTGSYMVDSFIVSSSPRDEYYTNANWFDGAKTT